MIMFCGFAIPEKLFRAVIRLLNLEDGLDWLLGEIEEVLDEPISV